MTFHSQYCALEQIKKGKSLGLEPDLLNVFKATIFKPIQRHLKYDDYRGLL